jgi:hypothetical protein
MSRYSCPSVLTFLAVSMLGAACAPAEADDDASTDESALVGTSPAATAALSAANVLSLATLRDDAKLPVETANAILANRRGADGIWGNEDDAGSYTKLSQLRALPGMKESVLNQLGAWALPRFVHPALPSRPGWNDEVKMDLHVQGSQAINWTGSRAGIEVDCSLAGLNPGFVTVTCEMKTSYNARTNMSRFNRTTRFEGLLVGDNVELTQLSGAAGPRNESWEIEQHVNLRLVTIRDGLYAMFDAYRLDRARSVRPALGLGSPTRADDELLETIRKGPADVDEVVDRREGVSCKKVCADRGQKCAWAFANTLRYDYNTNACRLPPAGEPLRNTPARETVGVPPLKCSDALYTEEPGGQYQSRICAVELHCACSEY